MVGMFGKEEYLIHAKENSATLIWSGCTLTYGGERNIATTQRWSLKKSLNIYGEHISDYRVSNI